MEQVLSYCGASPVPGALAERWNFDPVAMSLLAAGAFAYAACARHRDLGRSQRALFAAGWAVVAITVVSPLCALAVALFSARMAQHLLLTLVAAPLLVAGSQPASSARGSSVGALGAGIVFAACWWIWHAPAPYAAALRSDVVYGSMQLTLLASAVAVWRALAGPARFAAAGLALATAMQMGFLGALYTFAPAPLHPHHVATAASFGLSALEDQQLAGLLCWIPSCAAFVGFSLVAANRLLAPEALSTKRARVAG